MDSDQVEGFLEVCYGDDSCSNSCAEDSEESELKDIDVGGNDDSAEIKTLVELTASDVLKMEFESDEKAYDFYVRYARCYGFGVRKGDMGRDDNGIVIRRKFVCNRAGLREKKHYMRVDRKRDHRPETRTNCSARLMVYLDQNSHSWKVRSFEVSHNHDLTPIRYVHLIPNHRRLTDADKAQIDSMHGYGIQTCQIMGFMAGQAGGYDGVGFSKKDLYNYVDSQRRTKIVDGDACTAISYLQGKADVDPMTVVRYTTTDDERLANLFWADGMSRVDYEYFGDVIAFDSTYKKNKYNKPLVIFSGSNHHKQTCIFGFALLLDETADTYKWLLEQFLDVMGKQPSVVVTDGDEAMKDAIKATFVDATHRLCAWHLQKNATANIKDKGFCEEFSKCIFANWEPEEFEDRWTSMVDKFGLNNNNWVKKTYERKEMWATAYLRDKFYAGVRTTSRCEGINSFIKRYVRCRHNIFEIVQNLERAVREYRNNEVDAEFKSMYSKPVITTALESIELAAADVYTREIFQDVKKEIEGAAAIRVLGSESLGTTIIYRLTKFCSNRREWKVLYERNLDTFDCQCRLWNTRGIPCSHIFCVMQNEDVPELPAKMILKRWTKDAKSYDDSVVNDASDNQKMFLLRYGSLCAASNWMSYLGAKSFDSFCATRDVIFKATKDLEHKSCMLDTSPKPLPEKMVADPVVVKTKGAPSQKNGKKKRRCSNCDNIGHTKRNCPTGKTKGKSYSCSEDGDSALKKSANQLDATTNGVNSNCGPSVPEVGKLQAAEINRVTANDGSEMFPQPQFVLGPQGLWHQFRGPPDQFPWLSHPQNLGDPGHQWYLQNIVALGLHTNQPKNQG